MAADPFSFFRGTAGVMAAELSDEPTSGITVAAAALWEWGVRRLVTSVVVGGRDAGLSENEAIRPESLTARRSKD